MSDGAINVGSVGMKYERYIGNVQVAVAGTPLLDSENLKT